MAELTIVPQGRRKGQICEERAEGCVGLHDSVAYPWMWKSCEDLKSVVWTMFCLKDFYLRADPTKYSICILTAGLRVFSQGVNK